VKTKVPIGESESAAYRWIQIHTTVEADHFRAAVNSANLAMRYYAGTETQARIKSWILEGFKEFADVQSEFMRSLMERQDKMSCQGTSGSASGHDDGVP
jgi:pyrroloquinoline quinone (PQQ) biosynthesis protein C